jgi:subtilisin-like proprotein convertase family protein
VAQGDSDNSGTFTEVVTTPGTGAGSRPLKIYDDDADVGQLISDNPRDDQFVAFPGAVTAGAFASFGKVRVGVFPYAGFPMSIPDQSTIHSQIRVPRSAGIITDLDVFLAFDHTFDGDLDVTLTHVPTGTTLELFTDVGGTDAGLIVRLNDEAGVDIGSADNPDNELISGLFNPEGTAVLSVFDGEDASGTWDLQVTDDSLNDFGTLMGWSLIVNF